MSAPCIYHDDRESVTLCPNCDFGVCQQCMDEGDEGVCSTCAEERRVRRETSAVQREYEVAAQVRRCNYCRAAEDEETDLDEEGYCGACRVLSRCTTHAELIAVGHCKSCRQEYCRKCLGFQDVCQSCVAQQKHKPKPKPAGASSAQAAGARTAKKPTGATGGTGSTRPRKRPDGAGSGPPKGQRKRGTQPVEGEAPKKKKPSRGTDALHEKLKTKTKGKLRVQILAVSSVVAVVFIVMLSGMMIRASSPEEQAKRQQEQMIVVHRAVKHYQKVTGRLPGDSQDIYRALGDLHVRNFRRIKIGGKPGEVPGGIVYSKGESDGAFTVSGADLQGNYLKSDSGGVIYLDQYYDSGAAP